MPDETLLGARSDSVGGQPPGVWIRPSGYAKFATTVVMEIPCGAWQTKKYYDFLLAQQGKEYDKRAIYAFALNRDWREPDTWICSELQAAAGEYAEVWPQLYLAANKVTPVALALGCSFVQGTRIVT